MDNLNIDSDTKVLTHAFPVCQKWLIMHSANSGRAKGIATCDCASVQGRPKRKILVRTVLVRYRWYRTVPGTPTNNIQVLVPCTDPYCCASKQNQPQKQQGKLALRFIKNNKCFAANTKLIKRTNKVKNSRDLTATTCLRN
jgi:hypothetical protein